MTREATLTSFEIRDLLGEGCMGRVYRAIHRRTDVPVAVKVIASETDDEAVERFRDEVQSHAGLRHPGIVHLFEYGVVDESDGGPETDRLPAGSPYVAMEYASRGTLRGVMPISDWPTLRSLLVQILDALAHAHARGVVHRDLKPDNILVFDASSEDSDAPKIKLADFGIAHAFEQRPSPDSNRLDSPVGTLSYMAPEQLRGAWRNYGPWTDLYGLGCMAWELACGSPPFEAETPIATSIRHETAPRPDLEPLFGVPDGLEEWLHRAMAIAPEDRFRRAADAAHALPTGDLSGGERASGRRGDAAERESDDDRQLSVPRVAHEHRRSITLTNTELVDGAPGDAAATGGQSARGTAESEEDSEPEPEPPPSATPPIPETWGREFDDSLPSLLVGTGLGLFGLRETPAHCARWSIRPTTATTPTARPIASPARAKSTGSSTDFCDASRGIEPRSCGSTTPTGINSPSAGSSTSWRIRSIRSPPSFW